MGSNMTRLRPEALCELENATGYTEKQIREFYQQFMEDYPQGYVKLDQFEDFCQQFLADTSLLPFVLHIIKSADNEITAEHNMNFREFLTAFSIMETQDVRKRLEWAFQTMDYDEEEFISRDQARFIIQGINKLIQDNHSITPADDTVHELFNHLPNKTAKYINKQDFIKHAHCMDDLVKPLTPNKPMVKVIADTTQETSFTEQGAVGGEPEIDLSTRGGAADILTVDKSMFERAEKIYTQPSTVTA